MILATTKVEDFDRFVNVISTKGAEKRKQHGSKGSHVFRDPNEDDRVWVLFDWDAEGWQSYVSDPEVPAILQEAGHKGKPQAAELGGQYDSWCICPPEDRRLPPGAGSNTSPAGRALPCDAGPLTFALGFRPAMASLAAPTHHPRVKTEPETSPPPQAWLWRSRHPVRQSLSHRGAMSSRVMGSQHLSGEGEAR